MDHSPMLSTPTPETILRNGHISATGVPAFTTCKSAYLNPSLLQKVSSRYLLVVVRAKVLRSEDHFGVKVIWSIDAACGCNQIGRKPPSHIGGRSRPAA